MEVIAYLLITALLIVVVRVKQPEVFGYQENYKVQKIYKKRDKF